LTKAYISRVLHRAAPRRAVVSMDHPAKLRPVAQ